ncbi:MAG: DNA methylase, partial [Candidatus Bathyarchaeia archaeon]
RFWDAGISGADFWQSSIGPAVAVFGRYKKVLRQDGTEVSVRELLEETRKIVAQYALRRVLEKVGGDAYTVGGIDPVTRLYLIWRWTFGGGKIRVPFDDALRVARAKGVELHDIAKGDGLVKIKGEDVWVVGPSERKSDKRFMQSEQFSTIIDALHRAVIAWQSGDEVMLQLLLGQYGGNNLFWQVAQAIAEVLPEGDEERRLLHGFLATRSRKVRGEEQQPRLL